METEVEYKGKWWLPHNPSKKIDGTLIISPNGGNTLELRDVFEHQTMEKFLSEYENTEIILGISSSGSEITLSNCYPIQSTRGSNGFPTQVFHIDTTFINLHAETKEELKFKKIMVHFKYLDYFIVNRCIRQSSDKETEDLTIKILNIKPIPFFDYEDFNVSILPTYNISHSLAATEKLNIETVSLISIECEEEKNYKEFLKIVYKIQEFLTFCFSKPIYPLKMSGQSSSSKLISDDKTTQILNTIRIIKRWNDLFDPSDSEKIYRHEIPLTFNDIKDKIDTIMPNWFIKSDEYRSIFEMYLGTIFNPKMYLQHTFLTLVQCIESYHRKNPRYDDFLTEPEEYTRRIQIVNELLKKDNTVTPDQRRSIVNRLKLVNSPPLEKRIDEIVLAYPTISPVIIGKENSNFAKTVADNRNRLTHLDPKPGIKYATSEELYYLTLQLSMLMTTIILDEIGLQKQEIDSIILRISQNIG